MAIPDPEPGLVIHFNYLWSSEYDRGRQEARYPRPCAIVLSYRRTANGVAVAMLAPITHSEPRADEKAIEIPLAVKRRLGLDSQRSWVMLDEVNETAWPGYDLRLNAQGQYAYGFIPPNLYRQIKDGIRQVLEDSRLRRIPR